MPSAPAPLKKQQKPLVVFLRLYDLNKARMLRVCKRTGLDHNAIGLAGTLAEIARLEASAAPVTAKEAKTIEDFKKVTGSNDITPVLAAAMRDHVEREAKTVTGVRMVVDRIEIKAAKPATAA